MCLDLNIFEDLLIFIFALLDLSPKFPIRSQIF